MAPALTTTPIPDFDTLLREPGLDSLSFLKDVEAIASQPIAVLAAQVGEDRKHFMDFLKECGIESTGDRQLFTNTLAKAVRLGRITRGWAKPPPAPTTCVQCNRPPAKDKKLLVCGKCKIVRYCSTDCQKKHWKAGHKDCCQRPAPTSAQQWQNVDEGVGENDSLPSAWKRNVGPGGWDMPYGKGEVIDRRPD